MKPWALRTKVAWKDWRVRTEGVGETRGLAMAFALAALAVAGCSPAPSRAAAPPALMSWSDLMSRPLPKATQRIAYGSGPMQFADLWLPQGAGPFPVVLMIHGGCWQSDVASLEIMNYAAEALRRDGIAVWNIEYRGVDRPGGPYPGAFEDVAAAADALPKQASPYHLKIDRVVAVGHSAGGHFAPWLAARSHIPASSLLYARNPLPIAAVVSLGGLPDLADREIEEPGCGVGTVDRLVGAPTATHPDIYADTSPVDLAPITTPQIMINGAEDPIAPPLAAERYEAKIRAKGGAVRRVVIEDTGHAELIAPGTKAWAQEVAIIEAALKER
jgi:acetyl esterase/lipase